MRKKMPKKGCKEEHERLEIPLIESDKSEATDSPAILTGLQVVLYRLD